MAPSNNPSMDVSQVSGALRIVHDPRSDPGQRAEAQAFLDTLKTQSDAAAIGCELAAPQHDGTVRHFGLSLLQSAMRLRQMSASDIQHIRNVLLELAGEQHSPHYVREKVGVIWVYLVKQTWGTQSDPWKEMDAQLVSLWRQPLFVLSVLRTLYEDVFLLDDAMAARRGSEFNILCCSTLLDASASVEIHGPGFEALRASDEGWLTRITNLTKNQQDQQLLVKLLETLKAIVPWVPVQAAVQCELADLFLSCLNNAQVDARIVACDCLHILLSRRLEKAEFDAIVGKFMSTQGMQWIDGVYSSIKIDSEAIDDKEYVFLKKLVEMTVAVGEFVENPKKIRPIEGADLTAFLALLLKFAMHPSLLVSGLCLQFWCSILRLEVAPPQRDDVLPQLLSVACDRCIHYELTPEDSDARLFMEVDFSSSQEARSFYGDYKRYMTDVVRLIVCTSPIPALNYLHSRFQEFFQNDLGQQSLQQKLDDKQPPHILARSVIDFVESAMRGISRWQLIAGTSNPEEPQIMQMAEQWAVEMINLRFVETTLHRKLVECLVQFAPLFTKHHNNDILFKILERVLEACTFPWADEGSRQAIVELRASSGTELNRLAYMIPEALMQIYDQLEQVIGQLLVTGDVKEQESVLFKSFLLVVSQRSSLSNKTLPFERIVDPVLSSWTDEATVKGLSDLEWFMERVGIVDIARYFQRRGIEADTNLLSTPMDDEGRHLRAELAKKWQAIFPIRPTRIFIQYPIEKLDHASPEYQHLLKMWKPRVREFLPHILQLVAQIVAYYSPANWISLPAEVQTFVKTSCTERFWQVGVSMQSKDEFERDNEEASKTLRDFADSVGHAIKYTREYAFLTLGSISQLEETMYEIDNMGNLLFQAIAGGDTQGITSHCWRHTISIVVRNVVKNCPPEYMDKFLGPFVSQFLNKIQQVLIEKWRKLADTGYQLMDEEMMEQIDQENDNLSDEMMSEHLLRQLTAMVVRLIIDLVKLDNSSKRRRAIRQFALEDLTTLMAILQTCRTILSFKDSRCCYNICLILRDLVYYKGSDVIKKDPVVSDFFVEEIVPALLVVFFDDYFHESALEAGNIMTYIYVDSPQIIYRSFQHLGTSKTGMTLDDFVGSMNGLSNVEQHRGALMHYLNGFKDSKDDSTTRQKLLNRVQQPRLSQRQKPSFEDSYDAAATINLFNQD